MEVIRSMAALHVGATDSSLFFCQPLTITGSHRFFKIKITIANTVFLFENAKWYLGKVLKSHARTDSESMPLTGVA